MTNPQASAAPFGISGQVWEILACPSDDHGAVTPDEVTGEVVCTVCGRRFPVRDGIPVMLLDEATAPTR